MGAPVYIVMAYMHDGTVVTKEFAKEDLYRGEVGDAAKVLSAQARLMAQANVVVGINTETGQAVTLKNRWGPSGRPSVPSPTMMAVSPATKKLLQALEAGGYNAAPSRLMDKVLKIEELDTTSTQTCKCDIRDLLSTGHREGCVERKK